MTTSFKLEILLLPVLRCTPRIVGCGTRVDVDVEEEALLLLLSVDVGFCDLLDLLSMIVEVSPFGDVLFRWRLWLWLKKRRSRFGGTAQPGNWKQARPELRVMSE